MNLATRCAGVRRSLVVWLAMTAVAAVQAQVPDSVLVLSSYVGSFADTAVPACPPPVVDTTGWQLMNARVARVQLLLPPGYVEVPQADEYRHTSQLWHSIADSGWISVNIGPIGPTNATVHERGESRQANQANEADLDSLRQIAKLPFSQRPVRCRSEADSLRDAKEGRSVHCGHAPAQLSSCRERISAQFVWVASARDTGHRFGAFTAWAAWKSAPNVRLLITGIAETRAEQGRQLRVLRSVRLQ